MAVNYGVSGEQTCIIVGPANISVSGPSVPVIGSVDAPEGIAINPSEAAIGDPDLVMHVTGTGFEPYSKIVFNGGDEVTTFVSETELTTGVKPSLATVAIAVPVTVRNGTKHSNMVEFTFTEAGGATRSRKR